MNTKAQCVGFARLLATAALPALCGGCAIVAMSSMKNFSVSEELALDSSTEDVMPVVEQVGKSLGYRVTMRQKHDGFTSLGFERNTPFIATFATDYIRSAHVMVMQNPIQQKLHLTMIVVGNFGQGTEGDVQKALQAFKDKLQESLRAQKKPLS